MKTKLVSLKSVEKRMFEKVAQKLADLGISYELVEHEPALTTEQADRFIEGIEKTLWNDKRNSRPKGLEFLNIERYSLALPSLFPQTKLAEEFGDELIWGGIACDFAQDLPGAG